MARWLQVFDTYTFDIGHRAVKKHRNANAMSQGPCRQCSDEQCLVRVVTWSKKQKGDEEKKNVHEKDAPVDKEEEETTSIRRRGHPKKNQRPEPVTGGKDSEVDISTSDTNPVEPEGASTP